MNRSPILLPILTAAVLAPGPALADDWPRWLGTGTDATWREEGIVRELPAEPRVLWRVPAGLGYSAPSVSGGRVYVFDYLKSSGDINNRPSGKDRLQGRERIRCLDTVTGEELWSHSYNRPYFLSYPGGPRCAPTVADGRLYVLGAEGDLTCLDAEAGTVLWKTNFAEDYGAETPIWGHAAHPLVHDGRVYCVVGGQGSVAVAFDAATGEERWRALSATEPGYCPPTIVKRGGAEQLLIWHSDSLNSLAPATGAVHWSLPLKPNYGMSIMAPRPSGNLLFASGIGRVGALLELDSETPDADFVWRSKPKEGVYCANSTPFLRDGVIYGCDVETSALTAVDLQTAERLWETTAPTLGPNGNPRVRHGTAFLTFHEPTGRFFLFSETGDLILAELDREGYEELDRVHLLEPTNTAFGRPVVWAAPAFAEQSVFVRNDEEVIRVDLSAGG